MKLLTLLTIIFLSLASLASEKELHLKSSIDAVTVYQQGAQIKRSASAQLQPGISLVVFNNLPAYLDPNLIRFNGKGNYKVLGTFHRYSTDTISGKDIPAKLQKLFTKKADIEDLIERENGGLAVFDLEEQMLLANQVFAHKEEGISVEKLREAAIFIRERHSDIRNQRLIIYDKINALQAEIDDINNQINGIGVPQTSYSLEVIVRVQADAATTGEFNLSYITQAAGWYPSYDAHVKSLNDPLNLVCNAFVYQSTGEDWNKVKLSIATGSPNKTRVKPQLQPWFLGQPVMPASKAPSASSGQPMQLESVMSYADDMAEAKYVDVNVAYDVLDIKYEVAAKYDIPSDNSQNAVPIKNIPVNADFVYLCTPKIDKTAFLTARIADWRDLDLMNGALNVYIDENYIGQTSVNVNLQSDTLELSLGVDDRIEVSRKRAKADQKKQILQGNKVDSRAFDYVVKNNKKEKINIIIEDQLPISTNPDVVVEPASLSGGDYNPQTGMVKWLVKVEPTKSKSFSLKYTVTSPREIPIILE